MNLVDNNKIHIDRLKDGKSPYYCSSSTLISLYYLFSSIKDKIVKQRSSIELLIPLTLKLAEDDAKLFTLTKNKELSKDEYNDLISIFNDYKSLFDLSSDISLEYGQQKNNEFYYLLKNDLTFLANTLNDDLLILTEKSDRSNKRIYNDILKSILDNIERGFKL